MDLTDKQWEILQPLLPELPRRTDGRGRPWADNRKLLNGMLWVLRTGAQWQDLPGRFGTKSTCHRRFQQWVDAGVFAQILKSLAEDLTERSGLDLSECFVDATFASAKKGDCVGPTRRGKGSKIMAVADRAIRIRYEYRAENYLGFVHLGCIPILLRSPCLWADV
jgi:transposase